MENSGDDDDEGQDDEDNDDYGDDDDAADEDHQIQGFAVMQDNKAIFDDIEFSSFLPEQASHMNVQNGNLVLTDTCYVWSDEAFSI